MADLDECDKTEVDVFFWKGSSIAGCTSYLNVRVRLGLSPSPEEMERFNNLVEAAKALDAVAGISTTQISDST